MSTVDEDVQALNLSQTK